MPSPRVWVWAAVSLVCARPSAAQSIALSPYATGLSSPVGLAVPADGTGRLFIVQQGGMIRIHDGTQVVPTPFLNITPLVQFGGEQGLLGMAFHPNYPATPFFFVNYTCEGGSADCPQTGDTIIARYSRLGGEPQRGGSRSRAGCCWSSTSPSPTTTRAT